MSAEQEFKKAKVEKMEDENLATRISGTKIAKECRQEIKVITDQLIAEKGVTPGLAVVLVGARTDSATYVRMKKKAAAEVGFHSIDVDLDIEVSQEQLLAEVDKLNEDPKVHAILVQLPLPGHIDEATVLKRIRLEKDADGFLAENIGRVWLKGGEEPMAYPCTPWGVIELLQRSNIEISGKHCVVVGRSNIVGMPVGGLLQNLNGTVTTVHSRTKDMQDHIGRADILVAAIGKAEFIKGEWLKPGCVVIDVGINSKDDPTAKRGYRLVGDVDYESARKVASAITPVPGGVGPMTIAMLLKNTVGLARLSCGLPRMPPKTS